MHVLSRRVFRNSIFLIIFLNFKMLFNNVTSIKALSQMLRASSQDRARYFNLYWRKAQHDYNYQIENLLSSFCPQSGVRFRFCYVSYRQLYELIQAFLFELVFIVFYVMCEFDTREFLEHACISPVYADIEIYIICGFLISLLKFVFNLLTALTSRPPQIKVQEFNQALMERRFYQLNSQYKLQYNAEQGTRPSVRTSKSNSSQKSVRKNSGKMPASKTTIVPNLEEILPNLIMSDQEVVVSQRLERLDLRFSQSPAQSNLPFC